MLLQLRVAVGPLQTVREHRGGLDSEKKEGATICRTAEGDLSRQLSGAYSSIMLQLSTVAPGNIVVEKEQRETFLQLYSARAYRYRRYGTANSLLERCCPVCCQNRLLAQRGEIPSEASRRMVWDLRW